MNRPTTFVIGLICLQGFALVGCEERDQSKRTVAPRTNQRVILVEGSCREDHVRDSSLYEASTPMTGGERAITLSRCATRSAEQPIRKKPDPYEYSPPDEVEITVTQDLLENDHFTVPGISTHYLYDIDIRDSDDVPTLEFHATCELHVIRRNVEVVDDNAVRGARKQFAKLCKLQ